MFQITLDVAVESNFIGFNQIISFKSDPIDNDTVAWRAFYKAKDAIDALKMENVYVNMFIRGKLAAWYRR